MFGENAIHANFSVDNLAAAQDFYCNGLGFELVKTYQGQLMLQAGGGTKILVYEKADHRPWDSTVLGIEVADVEQAVAQLQTLGVNVEKLEGTNERGIMEDPDMGSAAWFKDPAGNWICISNMNP